MNTDNPRARLAPLVQVLLARLPGLIAVCRFGSFGTTHERAGSDIDLGLQPEHRLDPVALFQLASELGTIAHHAVDLVDMLNCSTVMRARIVATGEVIFCRDTYLCESFATTAFSRYAHLSTMSPSCNTCPQRNHACRAHGSAMLAVATCFEWVDHRDTVVALPCRKILGP